MYSLIRVSTTQFGFVSKLYKQLTLSELETKALLTKNYVVIKGIYAGPV